MELGCYENVQHRAFVRVVWCDGCSRWHFRLSLQQRLAPSSKRWENIYETEADFTPEMDNLGWTVPLVRAACLDLQRRYVEEEAGVTRLF